VQVERTSTANAPLTLVPVIDKRYVRTMMQKTPCVCIEDDLRQVKG